MNLLEFALGSAINYVAGASCRSFVRIKLRLEARLEAPATIESTIAGQSLERNQNHQVVDEATSPSFLFQQKGTHSFVQYAIKQI